MTLSVQALTTVARCETELGVSSASSVLEPLIEEASELLQEHLSRRLYYAEDVEERARIVGNELVLQHHTPILSVASVVDQDDDEVDSTTYAVSPGGTAIRRTSGRWPRGPVQRTPIAGDPMPGTETGYLLVTYTGGYVTPQQDIDDATLTRSLPYSIERAVVDMVSMLYRGRGRDPGVRAKSVSRASVQFGDGPLSLPAVRSVIGTYRHIEVL